MEDLLAMLRHALESYKQELEEVEKKSRPTDGLFGIGHSAKDDPCHIRFDENVGKIISKMCSAQPAPADAEQAIRMLLMQGKSKEWPMSAQLMFRAVERQTLSLIPYLDPEAALNLAKEYASYYKPWDRLPVQKQVLEALKKRK